MLGDRAKVLGAGQIRRDQPLVTTPADAVPVTDTPLGGCGGPSAPQAVRVRKAIRAMRGRARRGMAGLSGSGAKSGQFGFPAGDLGADLGWGGTSVRGARADRVFDT